jgi:hypothetical protein
MKLWHDEDCPRCQRAGTRESPPCLGLGGSHATLLNQLGVDHRRLTFRSGGRDHRLTDVHGELITEAIA